jgi:AAT family amino acid transporter/D-serine/D-alanine/glycine transporter
VDTGTVTLAVLYSANRISVALFGELEFWFALIKVVTIVGMILVRSGDHLFRHHPARQDGQLLQPVEPRRFHALRHPRRGDDPADRDVRLPGRRAGVTAGEAQNPERVLPSATNSVIWRILAFYVGALVIMMALVPWSELRPGVSPFVFVFERIGIPGAAGLINFVVITAAASSCNSGIFSTGRMLYTLAQFRQAPKALGRVNRHHLPANAITLSTLVMSIGVVLNYLVPEQVFVWVTSISLIGALWTWTIIVLAHLGYRRAVAAGTVKAVSFRMPGAPYMNWVVVAFMVAVCGLLALDPSTRVAL